MSTWSPPFSRCRNSGLSAKFGGTAQVPGRTGVRSIDGRDRGATIDTRSRYREGPRARVIVGAPYGWIKPRVSRPAGGMIDVSHEPPDSPDAGRDRTVLALYYREGPALADIRRGIRAAQIGLVINGTLVLVKLVAGILGNAYALIA